MMGRVALVLLVVASVGRRAHADARVLFERGQVAFAAGKYVEAAELFEQSFAESKRPQLLWNVASSNRRQYDLDHDVGRLRRARSVLENYLSLAAPEDNIEAQREIDSLDAQLRAIENAKPPVETTKPAPEPPKAAPPPPAPVANANANESGERPISKRWWLWTAVGVVVAGGGVGLGLALGLPDNATPMGGTAGSATVTF